MIPRHVDRPLKIAVVGAGISGLSAAWLLSKAHDVTVFERESRLGGHSNTVDVPRADGVIAVDTGFIVYNTASYPNLIALFDHLAVPTVETSMSFSVSLGRGEFEYSGTGLTGLFGQPANLLSAPHWRMIRDTLRFFREAPALEGLAGEVGPSLGDYLKTNGYSDAFITRHIVPMAAAIWSTPDAQVMAFPAAAFVRFFQNHGLLQVADRPAWRTVVGGSRVYVAKLRADMRARVVCSADALSVRRDGDRVQVAHDGAVEAYDACVIATHADQALALLSDADTTERNLLGAFGYIENRAVLHTDSSFMPRRRRLWSSWNYLGPASTQKTAASRAAANEVSLTYWMNNLQPLGPTPEVFVTLNPGHPVAAGREIAAFDYTHPMFDAAAMAAQRNLWTLQGRRNTFFCGSYFGYGFHEDGLQAGLAVAEELGGLRRPWQVERESARIHRRPEGARSTPPLEALA